MTRIALIFSLILFGATACGAPKTGPVEIHYDRDICAQCKMIISDPRFAAEVRDAEGVMHKFDDLGEAIQWIADQNMKTPQEIWVMSMRDGTTWLDARNAYYLDGQTTPMDFGFGAIPAAEQGAITYEKMAALVRNMERMKMNMDMGMGH